MKNLSDSWLERNEHDPVPIQGTCTIGRSTHSNVVLNDDRVSRRHALIHGQGNREFWLVDLGSSNGTYVNQRRVSQPLRLQDGDLIQIGPFCLVFRQTKDEATGFSEDATAVEFRSLSCWLLLADIVGSSQIAQRLDTMRLAMVTGGWLLDCKEVIERNGGMINKYLGDGFLAYWPATEPIPHRLSAALHELRGLQGSGKTPFRFVLHYGQVTVGGLASLGEESLVGREVNFVFRMEKLASRLHLSGLLSEPAHKQLAEHVTAAEAGSYSLDGFDETFRFFSM